SQFARECWFSLAIAEATLGKNRARSPRGIRGEHRHTRRERLDQGVGQPLESGRKYEHAPESEVAQWFRLHAGKDHFGVVARVPATQAQRCSDLT
ncbi:hypothetical protein RZS08_58700, partial [Arthrospira platensis SPKY1]|nr:hypothetical protein [Arthrospira platensis SPKY1]